MKTVKNGTTIIVTMCLLLPPTDMFARDRLQDLSHAFEALALERRGHLIWQMSNQQLKQIKQRESCSGSSLDREAVLQHSTPDRHVVALQQRGHVATSNQKLMKISQRCVCQAERDGSAVIHTCSYRVRHTGACLRRAAAPCEDVSRLR